MKRTSQSFCIVVLSGALALTLACGKKPDDAKISSDVQTKFSQDSGLADKQLAVQAYKGTVTLAGTVANEAQRNAASREAAAVPGVTQVINNLQIADSAPVERAQASAPAPQRREKPTPVKKSRKQRKSHHASADTDANSDSEPGNSGQEMAKNNPPPLAAQPASAPQSAPEPPKPRKLIVDQGTQLSIRLVDSIDSEKNQTGDTFHATLNAPITTDGEEALPAGADITGHLVEVKSAGKFAGQSVVAMQLDGINVGNKSYNLQTDQYRKQGSSRGKNTAEKVGGGAALGAIIGAIAGGGKGAAIGAAAGGGVGGGVQAATKSQQIKLPSETVLNFTLQAPITVIQAPRPDANRPKLEQSQ